MALKQAQPSSEVVGIPKSLKDRFKPATLLRQNPTKGFKIKVGGRSKVGKTEFALSAPKPIYIIDTESSVEQNLKNPKYDGVLDQIHVFDVMQETPISETESVFDPVGSLNELMNGVEQITSAIAHGEITGARGTIVIDSGSDVWAWMIQWLEDMEGITENQDIAGRVMRTKWGKPNKRYMKFIRMILKSDWNVIMTVRMAEAVDKKGADMGHDKAAQQKTTDHWFDCIAELKREGMDRVMYFMPIRGVGEPAPMSNPTWDTFKEHIFKQTGVKI
jgi:hypothetical protein